MTEKIRIAVVDRFPIMRDGIVQVLQRESDMEVVATGATAHEAARVQAQIDAAKLNHGNTEPQPPAS